MTSDTQRTAHQVMKEAFTHGTKLYRVTIHENLGPSTVSLNRLSSGQTFIFDRLSDNEDDKSVVLRLTQSEVYTLRSAYFTVEEAKEEDMKSSDPFDDPMSDSSERGQKVLSASDWTLVQTPVEYLDNNPDGPKVELARQMIQNGLPNVSRGK